MATQNDGDNKAFTDYLKDAPSLDEASSGATTELNGLISRAGAGRFAITTADGKTYELDVSVVRRFRAIESQGLARMATIEVSSEELKAAAVRQVKPLIKDVHKDPIKDIIHDGKHFWKDLIQDGTWQGKDFASDPISDKNLHKDPLTDPIGTGYADNIGPNTAAEGPIPDPWSQVDPQAGMRAAQAGMAPFVMATPHQAPAHLLALQAGAPTGLAAQAKPFVSDGGTLKEIAWGETVKEPIRDTHKELIRDTYKELIWDTWIENGPYTLQEGGGITLAEGGFDPGQVVTQPGVNYGMPGFM